MQTPACQYYSLLTRCVINVLILFMDPQCTFPPDGMMKRNVMPQGFCQASWLFSQHDGILLNVQYFQASSDS